MIDISLLNSNTVDKIVINEIINYDDSYLKNTDIKEITEVKVLGEIKKLDTGDLELNIEATGTMTLPCSVTLKPVKYPFNIKIDEIIDDIDENNLKKDVNTLELKSYLWENIVVEIPLRIVSSDAYEKEYKGDGWQLIKDGEKISNKNNPFEKLNQLLDKE